MERPGNKLATDRGVALAREGPNDRKRLLIRMAFVLADEFDLIASRSCSVKSKPVFVRERVGFEFLIWSGRGRDRTSLRQ